MPGKDEEGFLDKLSGWMTGRYSKSKKPTVAPPVKKKLPPSGVAPSDDLVDKLTKRNKFVAGKKQ